MPRPFRARQPLNTWRPRALAVLAALAVGVLAGHGWLLDRVLPPLLGPAAGSRPAARFEVSFVQALQPVAVVVPAAPPTPPPRRRLARLPAAAPAASAPSAAPQEGPVDVAPLPALAASEVPAPPAPLAALADLPELQALAAAPDAAAAPADAASATAAFEWPPSTRLSYRLTGDVRGPVEGQARVEWLRQGSRYQVRLEASVGPFFAPLLTRRESSEGDITPEGLFPRRYDMEMDVAFRATRRQTIFMDADAVRLPGGVTLPRPEGLQDAVSQFVQMTWLFTTQPQRLAPGQAIELPLALPRRVEPWAYDVQAGEPLHTVAGPVDTLHVKPRRLARAGDYTAEIWVAPALQNLPVRIKVHQDAQTYIDLQIDQLPEQAAPGR